MTEETLLNDKFSKQSEFRIVQTEHIINSGEFNKNILTFLKQKI